MNKPWDEPMPVSELERFAELKDIRVVFDVGARTSLDYLAIKPKAEYHLFEPWPPFYQWLQEATSGMKNVIVNPYGLGDTEGVIRYDVRLQKFDQQYAEGEELPIHTLDWYIKKNKIKRIDFLKIDTEQYDCKVLQGGRTAIGLARYIQHETWNAPENEITHNLLKKHYDCVDIGLRNMLCTLKK